MHLPVLLCIWLKINSKWAVLTQTKFVDVANMSASAFFINVRKVKELVSVMICVSIFLVTWK